MSKEKETFWNKIAKHIPEPIKKFGKKLGLGVSLLLATNAASANPGGTPSPENPDAVKIGTIHKISNIQNDITFAQDDIDSLIAQAQKDLENSKIKSYRGHKVDLSQIKSFEVGALFESGRNPCAKTSQYIGMCQLNRNNTLPRFIKEYCQNSEHFKELARFTTSAACHAPEFDKTWDKISTGPYAQEFLDLQDKALHKFQYEKAYDVLNKYNIFPKITKAEDCEIADNIVYAAGLKSCSNQNPLRTPEIFIRTVNDMCATALKEHGIQAHTNYQNADWLCYKSSSRGGTKKYHQLVNQAGEEMEQNIALIHEHNIPLDLSIEKIAAKTNETKRKAFGKMGKRNENEQRLMEDLAEYLRKEAFLATLIKQKEAPKENIQEIETPQNQADNFFAFSPQNIQEQMDKVSLEVSTIKAGIEKKIGTPQITKLTPEHAMVKTPSKMSRLFANAKQHFKAHRQEVTLAEVKKANERARAALRRERQLALEAQKKTPELGGNPPSSKEELLAQIQNDLTHPNGKKLTGREAKQAQRNLARFEHDEAYREAVIAAYMARNTQKDKA